MWVEVVQKKIQNNSNVEDLNFLVEIKNGKKFYLEKVLSSDYENVYWKFNSRFQKDSLEEDWIIFFSKSRKSFQNKEFLILRYFLRKFFISKKIFLVRQFFSNEKNKCFSRFLGSTVDPLINSPPLKIHPRPPNPKNSLLIFERP